MSPPQQAPGTAWCRDVMAAGGQKPKQAEAQGPGLAFSRTPERGLQPGSSHCLGTAHSLPAKQCCGVRSWNQGRLVAQEWHIPRTSEHAAGRGSVHVY